MTTPPDIRAIRERALRATPGEWRAMCEGNQYLGTAYMPMARLVGTSRVGGLPRPWNPYAAIAFGIKAEKHETSRFTDEDAAFIEAIQPQKALALCGEVERLRALVDAREHLLLHILDEVCALEDFDAESLRAEIVQTLEGTRVFDDNKVLRAENEALKGMLKHQSATELRLVDATIQAERRFREYGDLHAAKPDPVKAQRNYDMADQMLAALSTQPVAQTQDQEGEL